MPSTDTNYSARFELPELIEQYRTNTLKCRVYRGGILVPPVSGTVSVFDASNNAIVSDAAIITPIVGAASYNLLQIDIADQQLGEGWRIEWTLMMPDSVEHIFRNDAALVRARLYSPVTEADLYRRCPALNPESATAITSNSNFVDCIDESWTMIQNKLISRGNRPNLIMQPSALRAVHMALTLALIFEDMASRDNASYAERARQFRTEFDSEWINLRFEYDQADTGVSDSREQRPAVSSFWTNGKF